MSQAIKRVPDQGVLETPAVSLRSLLSMLLTLVLLVGLGFVGQSLQRPGSFPIRKVAVEGDFRHLPPRRVQRLVGQALQGGFFQVDVQQLRLGVLREPWVREASVQRVWPDTVRVVIEEQVPVARWGRDALLNTEAEVFRPARASFPKGLVRLQGPPGSEREVLVMYRDLAARLERLQLPLAHLTLSERGAWRFRLADETEVVLGRERVAERLDRFERAYRAQLVDAWSGIAAIDLRYTNGFTVMERKVEAAAEVTPRAGG